MQQRAKPTSCYKAVHVPWQPLALIQLSLVSSLRGYNGLAVGWLMAAHMIFKSEICGKIEELACGWVTKLLAEQHK